MMIPSEEMPSHRAMIRLAVVLHLPGMILLVATSKRLLSARQPLG
jgi:hypothetical protein